MKFLDKFSVFVFLAASAPTTLLWSFVYWSNFSVWNAASLVLKLIFVSSVAFAGIAIYKIEPKKIYHEAVGVFVRTVLAFSAGFSSFYLAMSEVSMLSLPQIQTSYVPIAILAFIFAALSLTNREKIS